MGGVFFSSNPDHINHAVSNSNVKTIEWGTVHKMHKLLQKHNGAQWIARRMRKQRKNGEETYNTSTSKEPAAALQTCAI